MDSFSGTEGRDSALPSLAKTRAGVISSRKLRLTVLGCCFCILSLDVVDHYLYGYPVHREASSQLTTKVSTKINAHPFVVVYDSDSNVAMQVQGVIPLIHENQTALDMRVTDPEDEDCIAAHDWNTHPYLFCNPVHEFDALGKILDDSLHYIARGSQRYTWKADDINGTSLAFKTGILHREIELIVHKKSQNDAIAMERLSASPYVLTSYGYCGVASLLELGEGTHWDLVTNARKTGVDTAPVEKLKICIQVASGLGDLHDIDFVHRDLEINQCVRVDGVYKLADFHNGRVLERNTDTGAVCRLVGGAGGGLDGPPEGGRDPPDYKKVDVYFLGNVMYHLLTNQWLFEKFEGKQFTRRQGKLIKELVEQGKRSPIPTHIKESKDPAIVAMMKGINMSWVQDFEERASAREVSDFLIHELEIIEDRKVQGVVRASVPPLPEDWNYDLEEAEDDDYWFPSNQ